MGDPGQILDDPRYSDGGLGGPNQSAMGMGQQYNTPSLVKRMLTPVISHTYHILMESLLLTREKEYALSHGGEYANERRAGSCQGDVDSECMR